MYILQKNVIRAGFKRRATLFDSKLGIINQNGKTE